MVRLNRLVLAGLAWPILLAAQQTSEISAILDRLDRLERENQALSQQVTELQSKLDALGRNGSTLSAAGDQLATPAPSDSGPKPQESIEERVNVAEARIDEQAQSKVEASQKFAIRITGMALVNAYMNSRNGGGNEYPTVAALNAGSAADGATLRQSIVGLDFHGPQTFLGGTVHGSLSMDFFTGGVSFNSTFRLRTGEIDLSWKTRSLMFGIDKPIFNPREPTSLAQVGLSPLTGAGNLWLWLPQLRGEQDFAFNGSTGLRARVGVLQTRETSPYDTPANTVPLTASRPAAEGRFEFYHNLDSDRKLEVAAGFHSSDTHAAGVSIPSRIFSTDWFMNPWKPMELTGVFFTGENVSHLGTGGVNQGYIVYGHDGEAITSRGGWDQITLHLLPRLDAHLFAGLQYYENSHLGRGDVSRDFAYGANLYFRIAPNVLLGPEISQLRTAYIAQGASINNHYDLALAYLF